MDNRQVNKIIEAFGTVATQLEDINTNIHGVEQDLNCINQSFDILNEGLKDINDRLDALLKGKHETIK